MLQDVASEQSMDLLPIHRSGGLVCDDYIPVLYQYTTNLHIHISSGNVGDSQAIGSCQFEPPHTMVWSPQYWFQGCPEVGPGNHWHLTSSINETKNLDASNCSLHQGLLTNQASDELVINTWALLLLPQCRAQNIGLYWKPWSSYARACCDGAWGAGGDWASWAGIRGDCPPGKIRLVLPAVSLEVSWHSTVEAVKGWLTWPGTTCVGTNPGASDCPTGVCPCTCKTVFCCSAIWVVSWTINACIFSMLTLCLLGTIRCWGIFSLSDN